MRLGPITIPWECNFDLKYLVPSSGFKVQRFVILNSVYLYSVVWIDLFHPVGETRNSVRLMGITIDRDQLEHFNPEP